MCTYVHPYKSKRYFQKTPENYMKVDTFFLFSPHDYHINMPEGAESIL